MRNDALVLYKREPARVVALGEKIEIRTRSGKSVRVRPKDIELLHGGPCANPGALVDDLRGDAAEVWELLGGEPTTLTDLADLLYGESSPQAVWSAWCQVTTGQFFEGTPDRIAPRSAEELERIRQEAAAAEQAAAAWEAFIARIRNGQFVAADAELLVDVERLADGRSERSRVLETIGRKQSPENAHALLLKIGYWDGSNNPYPRRLGVTLRSNEAEVQALLDEPRLDLTGLPAYAIDDAGNTDPDDAISFDGERLWVHVADVAALVPHGSAADLEARARGANLYLPDRIVHMLPPAVTEVLGLGLQEISPALSFGIRLDADGAPLDCVIEPSRVRVTRLSYEQAEERLAEPPLAALLARLTAFRTWRFAQGAVDLHLHETKLKVRDGRAEIIPLPRLRARDMVTDAMLLAGAAVAAFAEERVLALPFATQPAPDRQGLPDNPSTYAAMFALRNRMQRTELKCVAEPHGGLGLPRYVQATSPLRRYLDLVVHQQLRAHRAGGQVLDPKSLVELIGVTSLAAGNVRRAENLSNRHWTLVYLLQNPDWRGEGVVVEVGRQRGTVIIPALGMEKQATLPSGVTENDRVLVRVEGVDLAQQAAHLVVEPASPG